jgi:hypothetical protein
MNNDSKSTLHGNAAVKAVKTIPHKCSPRSLKR